MSDPTTIIGTPKHFVADGGTVWGTSRTNDYKIDQGVTEVDEETLRAIHLPPYISAAWGQHYDLLFQLAREEDARPTGPD